MTKYETLLVINGKTEVLNELVDIVLAGKSFKEASKTILEKLKEETLALRESK